MLSVFCCMFITRIATYSVSGWTSKPTPRSDNLQCTVVRQVSLHPDQTQPDVEAMFSKFSATMAFF